MPYPAGEFTPGGITGPTTTRAPRFENWLDDGPPGAKGAPISTNGQVFRPHTMPGTLQKVVMGITLGGLSAGMAYWANPMLKATVTKPDRGLYAFLRWTVAQIERYIAPRLNKVHHEVSKGYAHSAASPTQVFALGSRRWDQLIWNFAYFVHDVRLVTGRIVHTIIPREIAVKTVPLKIGQRKLRKGLATVTADQAATRKYFRNVINHDVHPRLGHVETAVRTRLPNEIRRNKRAADATAVRQKADHHWIIKLLPLLTVAGATALVLKAFKRLKLNFLTCQNVKDFGNEMCASPPGSGGRLGRFWRSFDRLFGPLLTELLAVSFVPFLLTEACAIVHEVETLAIAVQPELDALVLSIEGFVCGGVQDAPSGIVPSDLKRVAAMPTAV